MIRNTIYTGSKYGLGSIAGTLSELQALRQRMAGIGSGASYADILARLQAEYAEEAEVSQKSAADMTMDEYKEHIAKTIGAIPFDSTRLLDDEAIQISDEGWEKMKSDPLYEQWVLDTVRKDRATADPFGGMYGGHCTILRFGAEKSDYSREYWSKDLSAETSSGIFGSGIEDVFFTTKEQRAKQSRQYYENMMKLQMNRARLAFAQRIQAQSQKTANTPAKSAESMNASLLLNMLGGYMGF